MINIPTIIKVSAIPRSTRTSAAIAKFIAELEKISGDEAVGFTESEVKPQTVNLRVKTINEKNMVNGKQFKVERRKENGVVTSWISHK